MWTDAAQGAIAGAGALAAILSPVLLHVTSRRQTTQTENAALIESLQEERDAAVRRADALASQVALLWDYVLRLRYWIIKGRQDDPPSMPPGLTVSAVRARVEVPLPRAEVSSL